MIQIHTTKNKRIIRTSLEESIHQAIDECFDVEKFNSLVPKLYYPSGFATITKQDLLDFLND